MKTLDGSTKPREDRRGRGEDTGVLGGGGQQPAHGLCFSSFNCSVNHCNKLFTAPNSLGLVGSKAKKCLEKSFLGPEEEGGRLGSTRLWWGRSRRRRWETVELCGSRSQGSPGKLFQGAQHPLSQKVLNLNLLCAQPVFLLCLSDMLLTPSQQFCPGCFLLRSRASMAPPEFPPSSDRMPKLCYGFSRPKGERPGMPLIHIPRDRAGAGERTQVGRHLGRVSDSSYSRRCLHSWNIQDAL